MGAYADAGSTVIAGTLWDVSSDTGSTGATTKAAPAGTARGGNGLRLRWSPRIEGEAPDVMMICCRSRVGVVSGAGDFTRRLPGVMEDGVTVNGDDPMDWFGD